MTGIIRVAHDHGLKVIEDACQAHGARYLNRRAGDLGDAAAFSFYPSKNLGAIGDGGIVVTSDAALEERVRLLRNLGSQRKYFHEVKGYNHRLDTIHAAVLSVKLKRLDEANASRANTARLYEDMLSGLPLSTPWVNPDGDHVYHLYVIETDHREPLQAYLTERGISVGIHYPVPIHLQEAYADLGYPAGSFPTTEATAGRILSLPMYPHMPLESVVFVADSVRAYFQDR
jgi:dTDP-4-amino-4,6-dideoxygalactose transaminase